jgi:hypothetical protein
MSALLLQTRAGIGQLMARYADKLRRFTPAIKTERAPSSPIEYTRWMTEHAITKPNAITYSLEDIVQEVLDGHVRIPDFQRAFRWQWEDVRRLFESIVRGYPIGSLLLWSRPAKAARISLGAIVMDAPPSEEALWVVDGQQRLTSLASTLNDAGTKDLRFATSYDLATGLFTKTAEAAPHRVPLPIIFDLQRLIRWFSEHPESTQYFDEATRAAKAIRQYSIPAYIVKQQDEAVLRDIFDRMNNYGKRLTRAEVFSALHAGESEQGPPRTLSDIVDHIDALHGFGGLDEGTVLQAVLARRSPDVTRDIRAEFSSERVALEFSNESRDEAYRKGEEALGRAVRFLIDDAQVPHLGFLPYRYLLVVLTRFFAHHPEPARRNLELVRRWFWRATLVGPGMFSGSTPAMRFLGTQIIPDEEGKSVQALLKSVQPFSLNPPSVKSFQSTAANSRMLLCAMWSLNPRSVLNGEPYGRPLLASALQGRKTAVDVVFTLVRRRPGSDRARASNRFILLGDDSQEIARERFASAPPDISRRSWPKVLESHGLDDRLAMYLAEGQNEELLNKREELLNQILRRFLASMTESQLEDTPPLEALELDEDDEEIADES